MKNMLVFVKIDGVVGNIVFDSLHIMSNLTDSKILLSDYQNFVFLLLIKE